MSAEKKKYSEILVISVGATPQIITETLWYYTFNGTRKFDRIILITTSVGKDKIVSELYEKGWLNKLEKALSLPKGEFIIEDEDIVVLADSHGKALDDKRTSRDC